MGYSVYPAPSAAAKVQKTKIITDTQSWTVPADVSSLEVILCGGGGGGNHNGGAQANGGGGGSVFYNVLTVTPGSTHTVTIGAGGAINNFTSATSSTFGSLMEATGAKGGMPAAAGIPAGLGGPGGGMDGTSSNGRPGLSGAFGFGGGGGASGSGGMSNAGSNGGGYGADNGSREATAGAPNTGSGGGGGWGSSWPAKAGGSGVCIIKYWSAL